MAFTREDWNNILSAINALRDEIILADPEFEVGGICELPPALELVEIMHKWSVQDIQQAQDLLIAICEDATFSAIPQLWRTFIVDELVAAIEAGPCPQCDEDIKKIPVTTQGPFYIVTCNSVTTVYKADDDSVWPGCGSGDLLPHLSDNKQSKLIGVSRFWELRLISGFGAPGAFRTGNIKCDGTLEPQVIIQISGDQCNGVDIGGDIPTPGHGVSCIGLDCDDPACISGKNAVKSAAQSEEPTEWELWIYCSNN